MHTTTFSRKQLYDLVWSESLVSLSKKYNISDGGLRRACKRLGIPLPDMGHWNKVNAGKKVKIKPLQERHEGDQQIQLSLRSEGENGIEAEISPQLALQRIIEADPSIDLIVNEVLANPDPLVKTAQKEFSSKGDGSGFIRGDLRTTGSGNVFISVSPGLVDRALRIVDAFIKAMRQRGHDFIHEGDFYKVVVCGEPIGMALTEMQNRISSSDSWRTTILKANGSLMFKFEEHYVTTICKDGKEQKIEEQLSKIMARLELMAERLKKEREENERRWARMREEELIRKQFEERKKLEVKAFQQLVRAANRWKEAQIIREYIDQKEREALTANSIGEEMTAWLLWARNKVDWYDPLRGTQDEWLKDTSPDKILKEDTTKNANPWFDQKSKLKEEDEEWPLKPWYVKS